MFLQNWTFLSIFFAKFSSYSKNFRRIVAENGIETRYSKSAKIFTYEAKKFSNYGTQVLISAELKLNHSPNLFNIAYI